MHAILVERFGGPEVLQLASVEEPAPGPGEVLVRVAAAGVNPVDWKVRAGTAGDRFGRPPYVPGWDLAGEVEATGDDVWAFTAGDEVFGMPRFPEPAGCYAEYVCAPADHLAAAPAGTDRTAAGLPLAGLTALQVLDLAGVTEGQRVVRRLVRPDGPGLAGRAAGRRRASAPAGAGGQGARAGGARPHAGQDRAGGGALTRPNLRPPAPPGRRPLIRLRWRASAGKTAGGRS